MKPLFPEPPDEATLEEIRQWLREGNPTYLWRGHTHAKPEQGARVFYAMRFSVDSRHPAPCPVCSPWYGKFHRDGLVAWMPDTKTVSLIGPDCFRTISGGDHDEAMADLRKREKVARDRSFILLNLSVVGAAAEVLYRNLKIAKAVDGTRAAVRRKLKEANINIWPYVRDGNLSVEQMAPEVYRDRDGEARTRMVPSIVRVGSISGFRYYEPDAGNLAPLIEAAADTLNASVMTPSQVERLSASERDKMVRSISRAMDDGRRAVADLADIRRGASVESTATLRAWAQRPDSPINFYCRLRDGILSIGSSEADAQVIYLPEGFDFSIAELPKLNTTVG